MEKRLFRVTVEPEPFDMYVWADGDKEAQMLARNHASSELDNVGPDYHIGKPQVVVALDDVPEEYIGTIPYGEDNATIEELFGSTNEDTDWDNGAILPE